MITKERYSIEITADRREPYRTLLGAMRRSAELTFAGIPHAVVKEITEVRDVIVKQVDDAAIEKAAEMKARAIARLGTAA